MHSILESKYFNGLKWLHPSAGNAFLECYGSNPQFVSFPHFHIWSLNSVVLSQYSVVWVRSAAGVFILELALCKCQITITIVDEILLLYILLDYNLNGIKDIVVRLIMEIM